MRQQPINQALHLFNTQGFGASWKFIQAYHNVGNSKRTPQSWKLFCDTHGKKY